MALVSERLRPRAERRRRRGDARELRTNRTARNIPAISPTTPRSRPPARRRRLLRRHEEERAARTGGVFYIRGGDETSIAPSRPRSSQNLGDPNKNGLPLPRSPPPIRQVRGRRPPAYSDSQLSEAMAARATTRSPPTRTSGRRARSSSPTTNSTASTTTSPPRILSYGPDGLPLARGIRIPLLLISPYTRVARGLARRG